MRRLRAPMIMIIKVSEVHHIRTSGRSRDLEVHPQSNIRSGSACAQQCTTGRSPVSPLYGISREACLTARRSVYEVCNSDADLFATVAGQIHELELVKGKIYQLEQTHLAMKNR